MTPVKTFDAGAADQSHLYFKDGRLVLSASGPSFPPMTGQGGTVASNGRWQQTVDLTQYLEELVQRAVAKALSARS